MASTSFTPAPPEAAGSNNRRWMAAIGSAGAGIVFSIAAFESWFALSASESGTTVYEYFYPGSSFSVVGGGTSQSMGYAAAGAGPVGALYEGILATMLLLAVLAFLGCVLGVLGASGRLRNPDRFNTVWGLYVTVVFVDVILVALVPVIQPTLFGKSNGGCTGFPSGANPCNSYWGSGTASGLSLSWGADVGWYLAIAGAAMAATALGLWWSTAKDPWGAAGRPESFSAASGAPASPPGPPALGSADVDRLLNLKRMLDAGQLTGTEFQQLKSQILGPVPSSPPMSRNEAGEELLRLKSLHDAGVLTDAEYEELRKRVVARL